MMYELEHVHIIRVIRQRKLENSSTETHTSTRYNLLIFRIYVYVCTQCLYCKFEQKTRTSIFHYFGHVGKHLHFLRFFAIFESQLWPIEFLLGYICILVYAYTLYFAILNSALQA